MSILKIIKAYYSMQQNASQYSSVNEDYVKEKYKQVNIMHEVRNAE